MIDKSYYSIRDIAFNLDLSDYTVGKSIRDLDLLGYNNGGRVRVPREKIQRFCAAIELAKVSGMTLRKIRRLSTKDINELIVKLK